MRYSISMLHVLCMVTACSDTALVQSAVAQEVVHGLEGTYTDLLMGVPVLLPFRAGYNVPQQQQRAPTNSSKTKSGLLAVWNSAATV